MQPSITEVQIHPSCHTVIHCGTVAVNLYQLSRIYHRPTNIVMYNQREIVFPSFENDIPAMPTMVLRNVERLSDDRIRGDLRVLFYRKQLSDVPHMEGPCHPVWKHAYAHSENAQGDLSHSEWQLFRRVMCAHAADATLFLGQLWKTVRPRSICWNDLVDVAAELTSELIGMYNQQVPLSECLYRRRLLSVDRRTLGRACAACKEMKMGKQRRCPCKNGFYYCSTACQREHWDREHKLGCEYANRQLTPAP